MTMTTDDDFARIVAEEVKNKATTTQREFLRLPENWGRWSRALEALVDNLNRQIQRIDEEEAASIQNYKNLGTGGLKLLELSMADTETRRKKIKRFLHFVEVRRDEVARLILTNGTDVEGEDEEDRLSNFYKRAIERHRELSAKFGVETTVIDEALYHTLSGRWIFDDISEDDFPDLDSEYDDE